VLDERELATIDGGRVRVPEPGRLVDVQFRRFAGCPLCNLHLRSVVARHEEIVSAGVREVVVFHSSADELREPASDLPFAAVADEHVYDQWPVDEVLAPTAGATAGPGSNSPARPVRRARPRRPA
jgi:hypothetical protein